MISIDELFLPLLLSALFGLVSWFMLKLILKNSKKSAIIVSIFMILFFTYGHFYIAINGIDLVGFDTSKHYIFVIPFVVIFSISTFFIIRTKRKLDNVTAIGNGIAITLMIIAAVNIGTFGIQNFSSNEIAQDTIDMDSDMKNDLPDIYYIILDGYANAQTLQQNYSFDNSEFLTHLQNNDFIIPSKTHGNYPKTFMALSSSLNMKYVNDETNFDSIDLAQAAGQKLIQNNEVMKKLKSKGYTIISFDSGSWLTNSLRQADWHACATNYLNSEFLGMIVRTTMLNPIHVKLLESDVREGILCIFDELPKLNERTSQPIFVFAHIVVPHPPYIFDKNGDVPNIDSLSMTKGWDDREGYLGQLQFTNTKMKNVVDEILIQDKSSIIIIQSDHGPRAIDWDNPDTEMINTVFGIFNAYHFPNGGNDEIYDTITPVNSFKIIFNYYFDENYELSDDRAFFTNDNEPGRFDDVSHILKN